MMKKVTPNLVVVLMSAMFLMASSTSAFSSPSGYRKMKKVGFITPQGTTSLSKTTGINPSFLKMAEGGEGEAEKAVASSDGTFYDDDVRYLFYVLMQLLCYLDLFFYYYIDLVYFIIMYSLIFPFTKQSDSTIQRSTK